jgi:hypothetical protein
VEVGGLRKIGAKKMSRDEAIEACAKAMLRRREYGDQNWKQYPKEADLAADIVAALEALGIFKPVD